MALAVAVLLLATTVDDPTVSAFQNARPVQDPVLEAIAAAAGMPPLEDVVLPAGHREIRMRSEQVMVCCGARPMLQLVQSPSGTTGSLWLFRTVALRPGNPASRDDERCAPLREQHICVRLWNLRSTSWEAVGARLEQLKAWALSEPCNRPTIVRHADGSFSGSVGVVGDSGLLSVQRRIGSSMTGFLCIGPRHEREADGMAANALYEYFIGLNGPIPPESLLLAK